jgi:hypothetical protein
MTPVQQLLVEYINAHQASPEADPIPFLERASPGDRDWLGEMIDGYLERAPRRPFDPAGFENSRAAQIVGTIVETLDASATEPWTVLLPALRARARVKRSELVARLAAGLGVGDREDKVAIYYHQMEQGDLAPAGVSDRVLDVLGGILGETRERLRIAGAALGGPAGAAPGGVAFARMSLSDRAESADPTAPDRTGAVPEWDEVDELFRSS